MTEEVAMKSIKINSAADHVRSIAIAVLLLGCLISAATPALAQVGWAVGNSNGTSANILFTSTGGAAPAGGGAGWATQTVPGLGAVNLNCVFSRDGSVAWAVGNASGGSTILFGSGPVATFTWARVPVAGIPVNANLNSVFFADALNGWVVGDGGTILYSQGTNGNGAWKEETALENGNKITSKLNGVYFIAMEVKKETKYFGWAVGDGGTILYHDGLTNTWTKPGFPRGSTPLRLTSTSKVFVVTSTVGSMLWYMPSLITDKSGCPPTFSRGRTSTTRTGHPR
jgi:photosystem II stability/assembly factor-like uncharacterized protein